jgi:predicted phosphodiesterase
LIAFISDLHANAQALEVALNDIAKQNVSQIVCLGDVVGYGASPAKVCKSIMEHCPVTLQGNHDAALLDDLCARGFHERALQAIDWTRHSLDPELEEYWPLWDWLGALVPSMELDPGFGEPLQIVHASPCEPLSEYLLPNLPVDHKRLKANFAEAHHRLTFFGHTHHPGFFTPGAEFIRTTSGASTFELKPDLPYLINVGSVGQPRDGDPRLCYALYDGESIRWRRLKYDNQGAAQSIFDAEGLPNSLGERLLVGR